MTLVVLMDWFGDDFYVNPAQVVAIVRGDDGVRIEFAGGFSWRPDESYSISDLAELLAGKP